MPAMSVNYGDGNGMVTEQLRAYLEARAKGGVGLITVENANVQPDGRTEWGNPRIYADKYIPALTKLADSIKTNGAIASMQIVHAGIQALGVDEPKGPSAIPRMTDPDQKAPGKLTTKEAEDIVEKYGDAAKRAKLAGFDMVQIHGCHGCLVNQFLSPLTNKRDDKFGVDRVRFAVDIVKNIKEKCGLDFPIDFRLSAHEFLEDGINIEQSKTITKKLVSAGVDKFNISGGNYDSVHKMIPPMYIEPEGFYDFFKFASQIKEEVDVPVSSGGFITDPEKAERALQKDLVDMVFVGRQLIADPEWPRKAKNSPEDIRPCIACNEGCVGRLFNDQPSWCSVNTLNGYEYKWMDEDELPTATEEKKVLVIGGGPAGMEASRIASKRGHEVKLIDKEDELGGTLNISSIPDFKYRIREYIKWHEKQIEKSEVDVQLNTEVTKEVIEKENPDIVMMTTGSKSAVPDIPGVEKGILADDVLKGAETGEKIAIAGGGLVGSELALYLAKKGKDVTIVEALDEIGSDMEELAKTSFTWEKGKGGLLDNNDIDTKTNCTIVEIHDDGLVVSKKLQRETIETDTVVLAIGRRSVLDDSLKREAEEIAEEVHVIGDAKEPRRIIDSVHEGFNIAKSI